MISAWDWLAAGLFLVAVSALIATVVTFVAWLIWG
jgi:hypothetical protein